MINKIVYSCCVAIVCIAIIVSYAIYAMKENELMAQNIESAIAKGIDPISVRCSYVVGTDNVCISYGISNKGVAVK
jgi:hypothetical protein